MRYISIFITLLIMTTFLNSCFIGAGTHGKIKEYYFNNSNEEIVSIVDNFLVDNLEYYDTVIKDNGWIYIKIPTTKERFGFSIGGHSEIVLIAAGKENETTKWESDLGHYEKKEFIASFEKNFINKLKKIKPNKIKVLKDPFIFSSNKNIDTIWTHYVFNYDTLIAYTLPNEFDSLKLDYFEDLVLSFAKYSNQNIEINQYQNLFRINEDYSGYIQDSIYITAYYREIGQQKKYITIFNQQIWQDYISKSNYKKRQANYKSIRADKIKKGYAETEVYSEYSQELWMLNNDKFKKKNSR